MSTHPIEKKLGYRFIQKNLFQQAITHPSASHQNYQRLEFLGDRVLGLMIADWLMHYHSLSEGMMAQWLSCLTSRDYLVEIGKTLQLYPHIHSHLSSEHKRLGHDNLIADVLEALIGAVFIDSDYSTTYTIFIPHLTQKGHWLPPTQNAKNTLQEWTQKNQLPLPRYTLTQHDTDGFTVTCHIMGYEPTIGTASLKKNAEFQAAKHMLERINAMHTGT